MVMSVVTGSTSSSLNLDRDTGGYQLFGAVSQPGSTANNTAVIDANPTLHRAISAQGGIGQIGIGVRQPGQSDQSWQTYTANVLDTAYLGSTRYALRSVATGYASSARVWQTLKANPGYAVVDASIVQDGSGFPGSFTIKGISYNDTTFKPQKIEIRDSRTGTILPLTVIGVISTDAANVGAFTSGIYTGQNTFAHAGVPPVSPTTYVYRTAPGADVHATALLLGKTFLKQGLDVKEAQQEFTTGQAIGIGLNNLLQGFMGLGLIVGIAALGVIAFRSVVERRQQIGMMRAIGFQPADGAYGLLAGVQLRGHTGHAARRRPGPGPGEGHRRQPGQKRQQYHAFRPLAANPAHRGNRLRRLADHHLCAGLASVAGRARGCAALRIARVREEYEERQFGGCLSSRASRTPQLTKKVVSWSKGSPSRPKSPRRSGRSAPGRHAQTDQQRHRYRRNRTSSGSRHYGSGTQARKHAPPYRAPAPSLARPSC